MLAGSALTEAHRLEQVRIGQRTVGQMVTVFELLDLDTLDPAPWLRVAIPLLQLQHAESSQLAAAYVKTFAARYKAAAPSVLASFDVEQVVTSLTVTGPVRVKQALAGGAAQDEAFAKGRAAAARAGMRLALNGGRDTIRETVRADPAAIGWSRVTSGKCCAFCAMLASRGPDYNTEETASFEAHDGCSCSAEPVYSADQPWTPSAQRFRDLWDEATRGLSGADAIRAFRSALDS